MKVTGVLEMFSSPHYLKAELGFEPRFSSPFLGACSLRESEDQDYAQEEINEDLKGSQYYGLVSTHVPCHLGLWSTFCLQVGPDDRAASTWNHW